MPSDRRPTRPPAPASYVDGTRATAPVPLEETSSESAWQLFQELQRMDGVPVSGRDAGAPAPAPGFEPTQPMHARPPAPQSPSGPQQQPVTLEAVLQLARRNNRACPLPESWVALHRLLPARVADGKRFPAPASFDDAAWSVTSAMQKRLRLRDQIEWAQRMGALQAVFEFLSALREEEWHHFG